jgi:S-DNA-T family DNA segregation ATPase FtsK/SpoIIIE
MASYQARGRDPLFDSDTQALLERRGKELIGIGLFAVGALIWALLWSYSPNDPSWLAATDAPVQNWLGSIGAAIASPLIVVCGIGAYAIAAVFAVWGVRFMAHQGIDHAIPRVIFAPIAVALAAVYASTHAPTADWPHSFGLGGLFGDTVLGAILSLVPVKATLGLRILALVMASGMVAMSLFVLGFTRPELKNIGRFLLMGLIYAYAGLVASLRAVGRGLFIGYVRARGLSVREPAPAQATPAKPTAVVHRAPVMVAAPPQSAPEIELEEPARKGLLTGLFRRSAPKSSDVAPETPAAGPDAIGDPAISAKISEVIRNRMTAGRVMHADTSAPTRVEPPLAAPVSETVTAAVQAAARRSADPMLLDQTPAEPAQPQIFTPTRMPEPEPKKVVQHAPRKTTAPSKQARAEAQPSLNLEPSNEDRYEIPPLSLLSNPTKIQRLQLSDEALEENARMLENVLDDYGVKGEIVSVRPGPVVTMYELEPAPGLKASRVIGLADDIARSMSALSARVSTVPGRSVIGIELPNDSREQVLLREILSARGFGDTNMRLPLALGKDIAGDPVVSNLAKMPHLLIAGTTGSGKSVAINTMILSLLYRLTPEECRLIMIDPKMLELSVYDGIPHLLSPVVTDPKKAVVALKWVVGEMEERYRKMSRMGVRNIEGYNGRVEDALSRGELFSRTVQTGFDDETGDPIFETEETTPVKLPYIVVIVDEMADLMMVAGKEIEACIQRLAQMARASGIHLIMATQRPSVDVITGTIKANFPTRISFQVTSKIDSRTILGEQGAEQLLGMGDMLYMAGGAKITRVHGPFVSDEEVEEIVNHLKAFGPPEYVGGVVEGPDEATESSIDMVLGLGGNTDGEDALYDQAVQIVLQDRKCSTSYIQRKLAIGYNKAARLVEQMEDNGLVTAANHVGKRDILIPEQA